MSKTRGSLSSQLRVRSVYVCTRTMCICTQYVRRLCTYSCVHGLYRTYYIVCTHSIRTYYVRIVCTHTMYGCYAYILYAYTICTYYTHILYVHTFYAYYAYILLTHIMRAQFVPCIVCTHIMYAQFDVNYSNYIIVYRYLLCMYKILVCQKHVTSVKVKGRLFANCFYRKKSF